LNEFVYVTGCFGNVTHTIRVSYTLVHVVHIIVNTFF